MPTVPIQIQQALDRVVANLPSPAQSFLARHGDKVAIAAAGILVAFVARKIAAGGKASKADLTKDLTGKVAIITGGNGGIGYETALQLAKQNATVCIAARPSPKTTQAVESIRQKSKNPHVFAEDLDVQSLKSVRAFAERWRKSGSKIHWLINNAGVSSHNGRQVTPEGLETMIATNHLGHFLLTNLLLDIIVASGHARIINVSSEAHRNRELDLDDLNREKGFGNYSTYGESKLANVMFTAALARRLQGTDVITQSLHPGVVRTELIRGAPLWIRIVSVLITPLKILAKTPWEGAQTTLHCALSQEAGYLGGAYWKDCQVCSVRSKQGRDKEAQEKLWNVSAKIVGL
ncbi:hypothetical protein HK097_011062 [Rhizophlyctis rosea]|uniref:NAD(P)-binding protein n=1 Tax=Rhizophlyctis rosea TaxID=64517 RepID=A0AAD5SH00_9FUNG|nr:hypothetical protein HK097_011062 [Rhizophlyctis rosea]